MTVSQDRLKEVLVCDPATGLFVWRVRRSNVIKAGMKAGSLTKSGYITIQIDGIAYRASRLVFLWVTGRHPDPYCDHEDGNTANDAWTNIREASQPQNAKNRKLNVNNSLGIKGVCLYKGRFRAQIQADGQKFHLGFFDTIAEAKAAYMAGAEKHHGEFSRKPE